MTRCLIIGGSGWIGGKIARTLRQQGRPVRCLVRSGSASAELQELGCEIASGELADRASIVRALDGVSAVYVAVHTMSRQSRQRSNRSFMAFEIDGARNILAACNATSVRRLVYLTSIGTSPEASSEWLRQRAAIETLLIDSAVATTIIRPGMIVGKGGRGFETLVGQARRRVAVALDLDHQRMRTIAIDDLIYFLVGVLDDPHTFNRGFDVGNDDVLTSRQMIDIAADLLGRRQPLKIRLSRQLLALIAPMVDRTSGAPKGSFRGLVDSLDADASGDPTPIRTLMPRTLLTYRQAVQRAWQLDQVHTAAVKNASPFRVSRHTTIHTARGRAQ